MTKLYPCSKLEQFKVEREERGRKGERGRKRGKEEGREGGGRKREGGGYEDDCWTTSWFSTYSPMPTPNEQLHFYNSINF